MERRPVLLGDAATARTAVETKPLSSFPSTPFIKINIGGRRFMTSRATLFSKGSNFLTRLVENDETGGLPCIRDDKGHIFIDRNGELFALVLDYLRTGKLYRPPTITAMQLWAEFDFYQIDPSPLSSSSSRPAPIKSGIARDSSIQATLKMAESHWMLVATNWFEENKASLAVEIAERIKDGNYISTVPLTCDKQEDCAPSKWCYVGSLSKGQSLVLPFFLKTPMWEVFLSETVEAEWGITLEVQSTSTFSKSTLFLRFVVGTPSSKDVLERVYSLMQSWNSDRVDGSCCKIYKSS